MNNWVPSCYSACIQGVPINKGIERRLSSRLSILVVVLVVNLVVVFVDLVVVFVDLVVVFVDLVVVFDFWYLMHGEKVKTRLYVWRAFHKVGGSCILKIDKDIWYLDSFNLLNKLIFVTNFAISPMVDHILKISRPGVFDIRCLSWNTAFFVHEKMPHGSKTILK